MEQESGKRTLWHWASWIWGVSFLFFAVMTLVVDSRVIATLAALGIAALLLPPVRAWTHQKTGYSLPVWGRVLAVVVLMVAVVPPPNETARQPQGQAVEKAERPRAAALAPPPQAHVAEAIEDLLDRDIGGKPELESYVITPDGKSVRVIFRANQQWTTRLTRRGIERKMADIYECIFTASPSSDPAGINVVEATALYAIEDTYGNAHETMVYQTRLTRAKAERINWEQKYLLSWDRLWERTFMHQGFR